MAAGKHPSLRMAGIGLVACVACAHTGPGDGTQPAPDASPRSASGFYTAEQAARGRAAFRLDCGECHTASDFRGRDFEWDWRRRTVWDFFRRVRETMPEDFPGILPDRGYADVIAYILSLNGYAAGDVELHATEEAMDVIPLGPGAAKAPQPRESEQ